MHRITVFRKGTLLGDYNGVATGYYGNVLKPDKGIAYVKTIDEAEKLLDTSLTGSIKFLDIFYQGSTKGKKHIRELLKIYNIKLNI